MGAACGFCCFFGDDGARLAGSGGDDGGAGCAVNRSGLVAQVNWLKYGFLAK
jgi:hypothetical protein